MLPAFRSRLPSYLLMYSAWLVLLFVFTGGFQHFAEWMGSWSKWDALWYQKIWQGGYSQDQFQPMAFPPGYPLLVGLFSKITLLKFSVAAAVLNIFSFFVGAILAAELLAKRVSINPLPVFFLALTSPTSYFVLSPYSDSLFYLMFWAALFVALEKPLQKKARVIEFLILLATPWVRMTGFALASWIFLKRWSVIAIFVSLAGWLALNYFLTDDPFKFLEVQKLFLMPEGNFLKGASYSIRGFFSPALPLTDYSTVYLQIHFLPVLYFFSIIVSVVWLGRKKQWLVGVSILSVLLMSHNQSFWRSVVRYDWPLLPGVYAAGVWLLLKKMQQPSEMFAGVCLGILGATQFILQILFANMFRTGSWGF